MARGEPAIRVLTREQRELVYSYALDILAREGVRVDEDGVRCLMESATGPASGDGRVRLLAELVDWAIDAAPSTIDMFDRKGRPAFTLGGASPDTVFGIGLTNLYFQHPVSDETEAFNRSHQAQAVRLGGALESFDLVR